MSNRQRNLCVVVSLACCAVGLGLLVGINVSTAQEVVAPSVIATDSAASPAAGNGRVFAVAGQLTKDTYGLYLVDLDNATICMYEWIPQTRKLRLQAARTYLYDSQLDEYNTEISPREVRKLVWQQKRLGEVPTTQP